MGLRGVFLVLVGVVEEWIPSPACAMIGSFFAAYLILLYIDDHPAPRTLPDLLRAQLLIMYCTIPRAKEIKHWETTLFDRYRYAKPSFIIQVSFEKASQHDPRKHSSTPGTVLFKLALLVSLTKVFLFFCFRGFFVRGRFVRD